MSDQSSTTETLDRRRGFSRLIGGLVLLGALFFIPLPRTARVWQVLPDLAHAPLFAVIAGCFIAAIRVRTDQVPRAKLLGVWILSTCIGAGIELIQQLVGRDASIYDGIANALGAAARITWMAATQIGRVKKLLVCAALLLVASIRPVVLLSDCLFQYLDAPQIASFESPLELTRWSFQESHGTRSIKYATHGQFSLKLKLSRGTYPGASLDWPVSDWTRFESLQFDITVDQWAGDDLIVKLFDSDHNFETNDRFEKSIRLVPGLNSIRVDLNEVSSAPSNRRMQMDRIAFLQFYTVRPKAEGVLYIDNVRLE